MYNLDLKITGEGTVVVDGISYQQTNSIPIPQGDNVNIAIVPSNGYEVRSVYLDGISVKSQLCNRTLSIYHVSKDMNLTICFSQPTENPFTGDAITIKAFTMTFSLLGIIRLLGKEQKRGAHNVRSFLRRKVDRSPVIIIL